MSGHLVRLKSSFSSQLKITVTDSLLDVISNPVSRYRF